MCFKVLILVLISNGMRAVVRDQVFSSGHSGVDGNVVQYSWATNYTNVTGDVFGGYGH